VRLAEEGEALRGALAAADARGAQLGEELDVARGKL
jgi:hypothetical protein